MAGRRVLAWHRWSAHYLRAVLGHIRLVCSLLPKAGEAGYKTRIDYNGEKQEGSVRLRRNEP